MHYDLTRLIPDAALEFDPHPPVKFMAAAVAPRHHRIGKGKKRSVIAALFPEPLHVESPAPISANVPYQRGSRLIFSAFECVSIVSSFTSQ